MLKSVCPFLKAAASNPALLSNAAILSGQCPHMRSTGLCSQDVVAKLIDASKSGDIKKVAELSTAASCNMPNRPSIPVSEERKTVGGEYLPM